MKEKPTITSGTAAYEKPNSNEVDTSFSSSTSNTSTNSNRGNRTEGTIRKVHGKSQKNTTTFKEVDHAQMAAENFAKTIALQHTKDVYEIRYDTKPGEKSAFELKFFEDILVVDGEWHVIDRALSSVLPSLSTRATEYKKATEVQFEEARKKQNKEQLKQLTSQLKPLTAKALDFGSGDGRALGIWIKLADLLKPYGITLEVTSYDIVRSGVNSYKSKLTNPRLPQEYVDDLKETYGERLYQARKLDPEFLTKDRYDEDLKKLYSQDIYEETYSEVYCANLPKSGELVGKKLYREDKEKFVDDLSKITIDLDFDPNAAALKKQYGEELYERRKVADDFPSMSDYLALRTKYQETFKQDFFEALLVEGQPFTQEDVIKYAKDKAADKIDSLIKRMPKFLEVEEKTLAEAYGDEDLSLYPSDFIKDKNREADEKPLIEYCGTHQRDNLKIKFLLGSPELDQDQFKQILRDGESFDISLILYGCLSHIPEAEKRDGFLESIRDITSSDGRIAMTVPGQIFFKEDLKKMEWLVKSGLLSKSKIRHGDVIYTATDIKDSGASEAETENLRSLFFATYSADQLKELLEKISPKDHEIFISSLANPSTISNSNLAFRTAERVASQILSTVMNRPEFSKYVDAGYYGVVMPGAAEKKDSGPETQTAKETKTTNKKSETRGGWLTNILSGLGLANETKNHSL